MKFVTPKSVTEVETNKPEFPTGDTVPVGRLKSEPYVGDCKACSARVVDCCDQCERCVDCCICYGEVHPLSNRPTAQGEDE